MNYAYMRVNLSHIHCDASCIAASLQVLPQHLQDGWQPLIRQLLTVLSPVS